MSEVNSSPATVRRLAIAVRGVVQGVGFRPFVYNVARSYGLSGFVLNQSDTVRIEVQGHSEPLAGFLETLRARAPAQARIDSLDVTEIPCQGEEAGPFRILTSSSGAAPRPTIPADLATCGACVQEIFTAGERRERYPFTNCTNCGPRWSIIRRLPYDRPRTSMARFSMCTACQREYEDPADRRFHAQPIACPVCGPQLRLLRPDGSTVAERDEALRAAVAALKQGQIVALKGLGGFQLLVDATDQKAVLRLRQRKRRPDRPFAVMFPSLDGVRAACRISEPEARILCSPQAPILLVPRRESVLRRVVAERASDEAEKPELPEALRPQAGAYPNVVAASAENAEWPEALSAPARTGRVMADGPRPKAQRQSPTADAGASVAAAVAPGNPYLGVMLPYTPLHHLLCRAVARPIVCTSGNLSEEPMVTRTAEALERLGPIADFILTHDRPIVRPVDDSVARFGPHGLHILRRARGYAPLPVELAVAGPPMLAVGGHLKNTVALALGGQRLQVVLSPHIGDLDNVRSVEVFRQAIEDLLNFYEIRPELIVCDLHPDYASTCHAELLAARFEVPLLRVQHHHAHVAACMAEHGLAGPLLGLAWDGTGYGLDGTVWGGEALVWQEGRFERIAHLRTFALPGGDKAVREPRRSALGLICECFGQELIEATIDQRTDRAINKTTQQLTRQVQDWFRPNELRLLTSALARGLHSPRTSSIGRLFDAVAAICGLPARISFEGQAAMALEYAADWSISDAYPLPLRLPEEGTVRDIARQGGASLQPQPPGSDEKTGKGIPQRRSVSLKPEPPGPEDVRTAAQWDFEPLLCAVLEDRAAGVPVGAISARFHNALADAALQTARRSGCSRVVLSGGCFQNALLTARVCGRLEQSGFTVYVHEQVPPGDGGIALGQVLLGALSSKGVFHVSGNPG